MAISQSRYVNIISSVGGATAVPNKALVGRLFTGNSLMPPNAVLQFSNAVDVGTYFGTTSEEYYRALFYFSWISKNLISPPAIQFAYYNLAATAPSIIPAPQPTAIIGNWIAVTSGSLGLTVGANSTQISSIDFSGASTYADVASTLEDAIQGVGGVWADSTVTYLNGYFYFSFVTTGAATISVQPGSSGTDISQIGFLGWYPGQTYAGGIFSEATYLANAIWIDGQAVQTITGILSASVTLSNNFGSFLFLNNLAFDIADIEEAAAWNALAINNNQFLYTVPVIAANATTWAGDLASYGGTCLTLSQTPIVQTANITSSSSVVTGLMNATSLLQVGMPVSGTDIPAKTVIASIQNDNQITLSAAATGTETESLTFSTVQFPEQCPMMIEAATNYLGTNTVQNYMFQNFDPYLTPLVNADSTANSYDAVSVNYYGQTQSNGVPFNFYQRGLMQGTIFSPLDQNTYINEIWLKAAISTAFLNLLLNLTQLPANNYGASIALNTIQGVINQALLNGTISVSKALTTAQQSYITEISNDNNAWYQVQNSGYWVDAVVQPIPASSPVQYEIAYTLIYSKDDTIRYVSGNDILI